MRSDTLPKRVYLDVGALAAATLLLEGTLLRLLAVAQFYHFAFLVVSLALLGFGASGSILSVSYRLQNTSLSVLLPSVAAAFAGSIVVSYVAINWLPFDSYSIAWQRIQVLYFLLYFLALTLPFVLAGLGIGAALAKSGERSHIVYAANLIGSATGAVLAVVLLRLSGVPGALLAAATVALLPALSGRLRVPVAMCMALLAGALVWFATLNTAGDTPIGLSISPYKGLAYARQFPGARRVYGAWNELARLDVMADAGTRQLPGLSYTFPGNPPTQLGMAQDAGAVMPITLVDPADFDAADYMPEAFAFDLTPAASVLALEPGGGLSVLQALAGGANPVTAVVPNRLDLDAVAFAGDYDVYSHPAVEPTVMSSREYLQSDNRQYDIVMLPLISPYQPVSSGAYSLAETYLLTTEGLTQIVTKLEDDGMLVATRWLQTPPSESIRLLATIADALEQNGGVEPGDHIVMLRGIQTATIFAKRDGWSVDELTEMRAFAERLRYDIVWAPDVAVEEVNRYNRMPEPLHYLAAAQILSDNRDSFIRSYPFAIDPVTDDAPFFFHFFTWQQTPEVLATLGRTWQPFGGSGYFILFAMLALMLVLSAALIVTPLLIGRTRSGRTSGDGQVSRWRVMTYFGAIGLAFLLVEIPLIQKWILLVGHPIYAFTAVVLTLLIFSSVGSMLSRRRWASSPAAFGALVVLALLTPFVTSWYTVAALGWPPFIRVTGAGLLLAPLAILMGVPFPRGLAILDSRAPALTPWAWAVNGCASVIAGVLAAILSLSYGFTLVLLLGAVCYALAWAATPGRSTTPTLTPA